MDNQNRTYRTEQKRRNKTVFNAFSPVGTQRDQGSMQQLISMLGMKKQSIEVI